MDFRNFIFSPFFSLFSRKFYRDMSRASLSRGILYLVYLALLFSLIILIGFSVSLVPVADKTAEWLRDSMPALEFTKDGVKTDVEQPYSLTHPDWGPILIVDTSRDLVGDEEMRQTLLYLTKRKLYFWERARNEHRIIPIGPKTEEGLKNWQDIHVDGMVVWELYKAFKPFAFPMVFGISFGAFFALKTSAAFFYSLLALLLNLFRKEKLAYEKLLNLCCFAITPIALFQCFKLMVPEFPLRATFLLSLLVTGAFLGFAVLGTQEPEESIQQFK